MRHASGSNKRSIERKPPKRRRGFSGARPCSVGGGRPLGCPWPSQNPGPVAAVPVSRSACGGRRRALRPRGPRPGASAYRLLLWPPWSCCWRWSGCSRGLVLLATPARYSTRAAEPRSTGQGMVGVTGTCRPQSAGGVGSRGRGSRPGRRPRTRPPGPSTGVPPFKGRGG